MWQCRLWLESAAIHRLNGYYAYHWLQTESGAGVINIDHQSISLQANQGILLRPRVAHEYHPTGKEPWKVSFLTFNGTLCDSLADFLKLADFLVIDTVSPELTSFIPEVLNEFNNNHPIALLDQSVQIYKFIMLLKQNHLLNNHRYQDATITTPILQYIAAHYAEPITNDKLSKSTSYSVTYQNRVFKRLYDMTPARIPDRLSDAKGEGIVANQPNSGNWRDRTKSRLSQSVAFHWPVQEILQNHAVSFPGIHLENLTDSKQSHLWNQL